VNGIPTIAADARGEKGCGTNNRFQILSLDGGGLKGIFTASFLTATEEITGKRLADYFDLIVGTSTGGIIALALGLNCRPVEILGFYKDRGRDIFPAQDWSRRVIVNLKWIFRHKYPAQPLQKALQDYFGEQRLCDSQKPLIIPSYDSVRGDVYLYKTPHDDRLKTDYREFVRDVALATASAPTYFPATITDAGVRLVDGGVWANNPSMVALAEALGYMGRQQQDVAILSIGTTRPACTSMKQHITGGLWTWRSKALEFMMVGQSRAAENQCFHILAKDRFLRVNPVVGGPYSLDKMSSELEGIGRTEARNLVNEVDKLFLQHHAAPYRPLYTVANKPAEILKPKENA
jgi:patatin-like phospholipase/acyl hydrolase